MKHTNFKLILQQIRQYSTLYIQMALCGKTLREWLDERVGATPQPIIATIVMQILNGLDYIHSLDIVHHDIKVIYFILYSKKLKTRQSKIYNWN